MKDNLLALLPLTHLGVSLLHLLACLGDELEIG